MVWWRTQNADNEESPFSAHLIVLFRDLRSRISPDRKSMSVVQDELLGLLSSHEENGISDQTLREHFGVSSYELLVPVINELLQANRLQLYYQGSNLIYKLLNENTAAKFEGLG